MKNKFDYIHVLILKVIVKKTVDRLCLEHTNLASGLKILNVGFGLGIVCLSLSLQHIPLTMV